MEEEIILTKQQCLQIQQDLENGIEYYDDELFSVQSLQGVYQVYNEIYQKGAEILYDGYIMGLIGNFTAKLLENKLQLCVLQNYVDQDPGYTVLQKLDYWNEEQQIKPIQIDNWASQRLVKKPRVEQEPDENKNNTNVTQITDSNKLAQVSTDKKKNFRIGSSKKSAPSVPKEQFNPENLIEIEVIKVPDSQEEKLTEQLRLEREIKAQERQQKQDQIRKQKEIEEARKREFLKQQANLKNQTFTYDYDGQIIMTKQLKVETLPEKLSQLRFDNQSKPVISQQAYENCGIVIQESKFDVKSASIIQQTVFKPVEYQTVPPKIYESFQPHMGVQIKMENGQKKEGGEFQANNRMKRVDYDRICEEHIRQKQEYDNNKRRSQEEYLEQINEDNKSSFPLGSIMKEKSVFSKKSNVQFKKQSFKASEVMSNITQSKQKKEIKIQSEQQFISMLNEIEINPNSSRKRLQSANLYGVKKSQKSSRPQTSIKSTFLDNVTEFNQLKDLNFSQAKPDKQIQATKIHQVVQEFNVNQIIKNNNWGIQGSESAAQRSTDKPIKPRIQSSTSNRIRVNKVQKVV